MTYHLEECLIREMGIHCQLAVIQVAALALPGYWQYKSCPGQ